MNANFLGLFAVGLSLGAFALSHAILRRRTVPIRRIALGVFALLAVPSVLFGVHYLHVLPEWAWFYALRSWRGSELLVVFLGCAAGAAAALLPRWLVGLPLLGLAGLAVVPYIKPFVGPLADNVFKDRWKGDACLQSTPSTCGPASVSTILRRLGGDASERAVARAAYTYSGGTEGWHLARHVRDMGFAPRFDFRETFSPSVGLPAVVGVRLGSVGHFIAVLDVSGDQVTLADPLRGEERLSLAQFEHRYEFTGFHMTIAKVGKQESAIPK